MLVRRAIGAAVLAATVASAAEEPTLEITRDTMLDPGKRHGRILIRASGITVEGIVIFLDAKDLHSSVRPIQHMVCQRARRRSQRSSHARRSVKTPPLCQ